MNLELSKKIAAGFPVEMELEQGTLRIFDGRGFDRKGYAAYLKTRDSIIPIVGVGHTPQGALTDLFSGKAMVRLVS